MREPSERITPDTLPSSTKRLSTFALLRMVTIGLSSRALIRARNISKYLPLFGYTRLPPSTIKGTPWLSKKSIKAWLKKRAKQLRRKRLSEPVWARKSLSVAVFVRLQRPFPVMRNLRPACSIFSNKRTCFFPSAAVRAAIIPAAPAPITITSLASDVSNIFGVYAEYRNLGVVYYLLCISTKEQACQESVLFGVDNHEVGMYFAGVAQHRFRIVLITATHTGVRNALFGEIFFHLFEISPQRVGILGRFDKAEDVYFGAKNLGHGSCGGYLLT